MEISKDKKFIGTMFDEIAPRYDWLNSIISGMQHYRWRRNAIRVIKKQKKFGNILDLACGSGDLGLEFLKLKPTNLFSADISFEMLKINSKKIESGKNFPLKCESLQLPFKDDTFDAVGISFGVRNFNKLEDCIKEIYRVMKCGGIFLTIEMFSVSKKNLLQKVFDVYFRNVIPFIGNKIAHSNYAYDYLFNSVNTFYEVESYSAMLERCGFKVTLKKNNFLKFVYSVFAEKI